jgi:hypothetical protein
VSIIVSPLCRHRVAIVSPIQIPLSIVPQSVHGVYCSIETTRHHRMIGCAVKAYATLAAAIHRFPTTGPAADGTTYASTL